MWDATVSAGLTGESSHVVGSIFVGAALRVLGGAVVLLRLFAASTAVVERFDRDVGFRAFSGFVHRVAGEVGLLLLLDRHRLLYRTLCDLAYPEKSWRMGVARAGEHGARHTIDVQTLFIVCVLTKVTCARNPLSMMLDTTQ